MLLPVAAAGMLLMGGQAEAADTPYLPVADVAVDQAMAPLALAQASPSVPPSDVPVPVAPPPVVPTLGAAVPPPVQDQNDIVVTGEKGAPPGDPLEQVNAQSFEAVQAVDKAVIEPVAKAYNKGLPRPVRKGLRNFFSNLGEPVVALAYLLQFKPGKAVETVGRFSINTTLGFVGLFDVAKRKPFYLPYRPNGLANTLGYYGIGPGPYMYLPLVGPTTVRDLIGDTVDKLVVPFAVGKPFTKPAYVIPASVLDQLGERAAFDERIQDLRASDDPYGSYRDLYLKQRKAEIEALHGRVTPDVTPVYGPGLRVPGKPAPQPEGAQPGAGVPQAAEPQATVPQPADAAPAEPTPPQPVTE